MKITNRGKYALRAMLALAQLEKKKPISISVLAEQERISPMFLEQIFFKLRKAGIVASVRGPGGGFYFDKPLNTITLKDIFLASGEELKTPACGKHARKCEGMDRCLSHNVWNRVNNLVDDFFMHITLAAILEDGVDGEENKESYEKNTEN